MRLLSFDSPRLPTAEELGSLLWTPWDGKAEQEPDTASDKQALIDALAGFWPGATEMSLWTASTVPCDNSSAWSIDPLRGTYSMSPRNKHFQIILVSNPLPVYEFRRWTPAEPSGLRYQKHPDDPTQIIDRKTGLGWSLPALPHPMTWMQAITEYLGPSPFPR